MRDNAQVGDATAASVEMRAQGAGEAKGRGYFNVECVGADGRVKWRERVENTWMTVGKNDMLDKYLAGSGYTAAWFLGLISSVGYSTIAAGDTMGSHAGWTEAGPTNAPNYSQGTRPAPTFGAAAAGVKATSSNVSFSISQNGTVKGTFLTSNSAKDGTTGTLFAAGLFSGGDRAVINGDTLNCSYSATLT